MTHCTSITLCISVRSIVYVWLLCASSVWMLTYVKAFRIATTAAYHRGSGVGIVARAITSSSARYATAVDQDKRQSSGGVVSINTNCIDYNPVFTKKLPFQELCSDPLLLQALHNRNMEIATDIQGETFAKIEKGQDVVIGAETGSGKTLAYMLPLLNRYIHTSTVNVAATMAAVEDENVEVEEAPVAVDSGLDEDLVVEDKGYNNLKSQQRGVILAPSNDLCDQIVNMTTFLFDHYKNNNVAIKVCKLCIFSFQSSECIGLLMINSTCL